MTKNTYTAPPTPEDALATSKQVLTLLEETLEKLNKTAGTTYTQDWVNCPVCNAPDTLQETNSDGNKLIFCDNHACLSNGGRYQYFKPVIE